MATQGKAFIALNLVQGSWRLAIRLRRYYMSGERARPKMYAGGAQTTGLETQ
jgi:hypothetical protein